MGLFLDVAAVSGRAGVLVLLLYFSGFLDLRRAFSLKT